ncbi:AAA family ATPase [Streptomyces sp. NPDC046977]|uniref:helix-turn-helix transcriptional regulator n=1 Tax=Streptomyces sp. NPDC046977 TaxID=3154703 RepID=UPI003406124E
MTQVLVSPLFVGRADEMATLRQALEDAVAGRPRMVLVDGEAGVGKSRTVQELASVARSYGALVAVGRCVETGGEEIPFAAPLEALRWVLRSTSGASEPEGGAALVDVARELSGTALAGRALLPPGAEGASGGSDGAARLFELTVQSIHRVSVERPLLLVLEDLQWADASTRQLLLHLFKSLDTGHLMIVGTYRSDDLHGRHPLSPFLAEATRLRDLIPVQLLPLKREDVSAQMAAILGAKPHPAEVDRVFERSEGNAFFVEELVHACRNGLQGKLRDSLSQLLLARLHVLPDAAQEVVRIAAVSGGDMSHNLLRKVAQLADQELLAAVRLTVDCQLLQPTPDGAGYEFRHSLVREAAHAEVLPGERILWSRRCAEALENEPTLVQPEEYRARLAGYWSGAQVPARAFHAYVAAAACARSRYAHVEQLRLLGHAIEQWHQIPSDTRRSLRLPRDPLTDRTPLPTGADGFVYADLLADAAAAARLSGERERAMALCKEAIALPEDHIDPLRRAWFWVERSQVAHELGTGDGRRELERAEEVVHAQSPSPVQAEILARTAAWGARHQPGPGSRDDVERAIAYARDVGDYPRELDGRVTRAWLLAGTERFTDSVVELQDVLQRAQEAGFIAVVGRACIMLPSVLEGMGRSREAVAAAEEGARLCRSLGLANAEARVHCNRAVSLFSLGLWRESVYAVSEAERLGRSPKALGVVAALRAGMASAIGDLDESARQLSAARLTFGDHYPQPQLMIPLAGVAVHLAAQAGRMAEARSELAGALSRGLPPGTERYSLGLLFAGAQAEANVPAAGAGPEREHAVSVIREHTIAIPPRVQVWQAYRLMIEAELALVTGEPGSEAWEEAMQALIGLERPFELAIARSRWAARALAVHTPPQDVEPILSQAWQTARSLGARLLRDDIALLARRTGIVLAAGDVHDEPVMPVEASSAGHPALSALLQRLTARETEVLELVARGYSNGRIAAALYVSTKTVSAHVSRILAKLRVKSRTEAAAIVNGLGLEGAE